jgi:RNA polymerase sigma-70 factor (ECF subfamily)
MNAEASAKSGEEWGALMAHAQRGDAAAYRALLHLVVPYLRQVASGYFRSPADIEDAVQDVLLTLHTIRHTYDPARPFKPWLLAIARRRVADRLRVQFRRRSRETFLATEHETFAAPETNSIERESEAKRIRQAIAQLPEGQRQAVVMLKLEEKSLAESAAATGLSVAALKVSSHRALKTLRKLLEKA